MCYLKSELERQIHPLVMITSPQMSIHNLHFHIEPSHFPTSFYLLSPIKNLFHSESDRELSLLLPSDKVSYYRYPSLRVCVLQERHQPCHVCTRTGIVPTSPSYHVSLGSTRPDRLVSESFTRLLTGFLSTNFLGF